MDHLDDLGMEIYETDPELTLTDPIEAEVDDRPEVGRRWWSISHRLEYYEELPIRRRSITEITYFYRMTPVKRA